jgi:type IV pilus assembly protein PilA
MRASLRSRSRGGFTLIELMITCSLIGVIASIAIPQFLSYQARSRRSEGMVGVSAIAHAYIAYQAEAGLFPDILHHPSGGFPTLPGFSVLGAKKLIWDPDAAKFFNVVGYKPEGNVWHTYEVTSDCSPALGPGGVCSEQTCFTVVAHGDVDGNGVMGAVMYVHPARDAAGDPAAYCGSTFGYGVPINPKSGMDVFDETAVYQTDPY